MQFASCNIYDDSLLLPLHVSVIRLRSCWIIVLQKFESMGFHDITIFFYLISLSLVLSRLGSFWKTTSYWVSGRNRDRNTNIRPNPHTSSPSSAILTRSCPHWLVFLPEFDRILIGKKMYFQRFCKTEFWRFYWLYIANHLHFCDIA